MYFVDSERLGHWRTAPFREYLNVLDADWSASDRPLLACSDGTLRVFDMSLNKCNSPVERCPKDVSISPCLMERTALQAVKTAVQLNITDYSQLVNERSKLQIVNFLNHVNSGDRQVGGETTAELLKCCRKAAVLCSGDVQCVDFWQVAAYYLNYYVKKEETNSLDTVYDLLCPASAYKQMAAERAALYQSKPRAYEHTRQLTRDHLLLNDKDKAITLLLNTEQDHEHFYTNHLLACLAAVLQPTGCHGNAHSTIKLVATHMIASGHVWQGIEILILNGQVPDACRYLQANNLWEDSARVAKLLLMDKAGDNSAEVAEAADIWQKWAQHLASNRQKFFATLVLVAVGCWHKAAELLVQQQMHDSAALLLRLAEQLGIYQAKDDSQLHFQVS